MWKHCFYGPVEHYRAAMRRAARTALKATSGSAPGGSAQGGGDVVGDVGVAKGARSELRAVHVLFDACAVEAAAYYHALVRRLEAAYCADRAAEAHHYQALSTAAAGARPDEEGAAGGRGDLAARLRCRLATLARCWVYLGDLARYPSTDHQQYLRRTSHTFNL
jgi:hypothetical protein